MFLRDVLSAVEFAMQAHKGQFRNDGETPYIIHPIRTALIVNQHVDDVEMVIAAILHDVIEDTNFTSRDIEIRFGSRVASLVESVTKDTSLPKKERNKEYLKRLRSSESSDTIILKLADRLDNVLDMDSSSEKFKKGYEKNTVEFLDAIPKRFMDIMVVVGLMDKIKNVLWD